MEKELKVAIVQTTLDNRVAWKVDTSRPVRMDFNEASRIWSEVIHTLDDYVNIEESRKPDIILLPEFTVAERFESEIKKLSDQTGVSLLLALISKQMENLLRIRLYAQSHTDGLMVLVDQDLKLSALENILLHVRN